MSKRSKIINRLTVLIILCLLYGSYVSAQNASAETVSDEQIIAKINEYMKAAVEIEGFTGSILVARNGNPVFSKGYGMANIELGVPNEPQSVFRLGSITKQFTGMAIAMLEERGKLSVNDSLCKYLADCPSVWKPITLKHLLGHTSGIANYTTFEDFAKTAIMPTTNDEMIEKLRTKPLDFEPGTKSSYSNSGYYLLGEVIEKASGKSYSDFLQENIFSPLGMKSTGYDNPLSIIKNRAAGYVRQNGEIRNAPYIDLSVPYAAGALYSTTGDLLLWDQALYTTKLVSEKTLNEVFTPIKNTSGYGYGWNIGNSFEHRTISHGGAINGFASQLLRFPDDAVTVVILSNLQGTQAGNVARVLAAIVFGEKYEFPQKRKEVAVEAKILEKYVGEYKIEQPIIVIGILVEDGKLFAQIASQPKIAFVPESETKFFSKDVNATITFELDENGKVTGLKLSQGGGVFPAKKIK